jgi:hypothetical protein
MLEPLDLRDVRVSVDDRAAVLEAGGEPGFAPLARAGVVHHPDPHLADLDDPLPRQRLLEGLLVHVPAHADDGWAELLELLQELGRNEVAGVQQEVGPRDQTDAFLGERPRSAREVRVGDDGDAGQVVATGSGTATGGSCKNRPAFQTSSPSA